MAKNHISSGDRIKLYAGADRTAGHLVADVVTENTTRRMAGIALADATAGQYYWVALSGVWHIRVPHPMSGSEAGREVFFEDNGWHGPYVSNDVDLTCDHQNHIPFGKILSDPVEDTETGIWYADVLMYPPIYPYSDAIGDDMTGGDAA